MLAGMCLLLQTLIDGGESFEGSFEVATMPAAIMPGAGDIVDHELCRKWFRIESRTSEPGANGATNAVGPTFPAGTPSSTNKTRHQRAHRRVASPAGLVDRIKKGFMGAGVDPVSLARQMRCTAPDRRMDVLAGTLFSAARPTRQL